MKLGISATENNLHAAVDQRFGRCRYFLIVDSETKEINTIDNQATQAQGGAGIQAAQTLVDHGVEAVLTGNIGPNAFQTLSAAHIKVYTNVNGSIEQAVDQYVQGKLKETQSSTVGSHAGMRGG